MGCTGDREKGPPEYTQKWAFITLSDFKATSAWTSVAYIWLWFMALVAVAVYAVDTFTAVNLIVFDKWNSQIQPAIPFRYSRWIFAGCILLSWALCFYEWFRAVRVIKRGGVAQSYMDPLAVTLQSMRPQGWRRFLVFTELTKSKKGADYVAFFVYFGFNGAIRVILAEGPRQVVNALSLYAVMKADLLVTSATQHNSFVQFFVNIQTLANKDEEQAVILFSMLFTLVIWVFSALSLIAATILYLVFLWHYIPQRDGRLSIYCRRKVDRRLEKIVEYKVKAAIEEDERQKQKAEMKAELKRQKTAELPPAGKPAMIRQPTIPQLGDSPELKKDEKMQEFGLARQDTSTTVSTLPRYESRPPTRNGSQQLHRQPTLPDFAAERPGMPSRNGTQGSAWSSAPSYESEAPLLPNAGYAGGRESPAPQMPPQAAFSRQGSNGSFGRPMPGRIMTQGSQGTQRSYTPVSRMDATNSQQQRPFSPMSKQGSISSRPAPEPRGPPLRSNTGFSFEDPQSAVSPSSSQGPYGRPMGPPMRQNTQETFRTAPVRQESQASSFSRPTYGSVHSQQSFSRPMVSHQPRNPSQTSFSQPFSPPVAEPAATHPESYEMMSQSSYSSSNSAFAPAATGETGYVAFNPTMLTPSSTPGPQLQQGPRRNITVAGDAGTANNYFGQVRDVPQRSATAPIADNRLTTGYADIFDDYGDSARNSVAPPVQHDTQEIRRPSPPTGGPQRAHTAGPEQGLQYHQQNRF
ncbi:hypothetical protein LTR85_002552 [Meristemomyces frigidus]|nr:hypothetical protein LTR85_002552 [Meristemomyces frigidus]